MSISNDIKLLLDIQDENIISEENCVLQGKFKGNDCKYVDAVLTYKPPHCKHCGVKNEAYTIFKNGTQLSRITLPIWNATYLFTFEKTTVFMQNMQP